MKHRFPLISFPQGIFVFAVLLLTAPFRLWAGEGMWLPHLLKNLNEQEMQSMGMKLTAEDIYSINRNSLKDAVVLFGGGCTGELISDQGLLITNHHCGYRQIQSHSSIEKDYLQYGFWAMNKKEELPNPDLTVTFIKEIVDVTDKILAMVKDTVISRDAAIVRAMRKFESDYKVEKGLKVVVKPFYQDNVFYLFITQVFKDVRLVGAPSSSIGKFGSDTDNWMWPRHTGDFSVFRIYADKNNEPADYSPDNVPYKPLHYFPISLKDIQEGDFTLVYGFPGRTTEYLPADAVTLTAKVNDSVKVAIRTQRLYVLDKAMRSNDTVRIQYSAKYASISNAWKKWQGEMKGIEKTGIIATKKKLEIEFEERAQKNGRKEWIGLTDKFANAYQSITPLSRQRDYYLEAFLGIELFQLTNGIQNLLSKLDHPKLSKEEKSKELENYAKGLTAFFKNYHRPTDRLVAAKLLPLYNNVLDDELRKTLLPDYNRKFKMNTDQYLDVLYGKTKILNQTTLVNLLRAYLDGDKDILKDPAIKAFRPVSNYFEQQIKPAFTKLESEVNFLQSAYMKGLMELFPERKFYPDANGTLRVAYGNVQGYRPFDGARYQWYSTVDGILEKENPNLDEFVVQPKLKELILKRDFGPYAYKDGSMRVAFVASNHTTGGNSGSPVLNAEGHLIGINFDRCWEGTMSDIVYSKDLCRNISCDMHYLLFVIDKVAGAGYLLEEMKIIR
jgi:hypothetical protein